MKRHSRWTKALLASIALIGSLHAPLHAEETAEQAELVRPESAAVLDQRALLKASAEQALASAKAAMHADIAIDLTQSIGNNPAVTVADNNN
ncbi:MAG: hypothetical protein AAF290_11045 [Pseudomonadota bacterium]